MGGRRFSPGRVTLIAAPTGSGKTLAAFYAELDLLFREGREGKLPDATRVVYVSPLKALSNDIHKNLDESLVGIRKALFDATGQDVDVRAAVRTGDTQATHRQALAELATQGWVTADGFAGLRALLLPQEKRVPFADLARRPRHKAVSSVEFAGRWSLLRDPNTLSPVPGEALAAHGPQSRTGVSPVPSGVPPTSATAPTRDQAMETFARVLLRRYGVLFRALLGRETRKVSWYELGRVYRRLESRGEIRGGHFVSGVGGEQFALPEAIGLLRSICKAAPDGQRVTISGADPLNLTGILGPGRRVASTTANRVLLRAGVPVAALEAGEFENLEDGTATPNPSLDRALRMGSMPAALRSLLRLDLSSSAR